MVLPRHPCSPKSSILERKHVVRLPGLGVVLLEVASCHRLPSETGEKSHVWEHCGSLHNSAAMASLHAVTDLTAAWQRDQRSCANSPIPSPSTVRLLYPAAGRCSPCNHPTYRYPTNILCSRNISATYQGRHSAGCNVEVNGSSSSTEGDNSSCDPEQSSVEFTIPRRAFLGATSATVPTVLSQLVPGPFAVALTAPPPSKARTALPPLIPPCPSGSTVNLSILGEGGLGVSVYPDFVYNPRGGGGVATAIDSEDGRIKVKFDLTTLNIPAVEFSTTSLLGVPLPPPLRIDIQSQGLEGYIDRHTGQVELNFLAKFFFTAGPLYKAPPLLVTTVLTTEFSQGVSRSGQGERMDSEGKCRLVGTARVPRVDDAFFNNFLMLPTDVLAELPARFVFSPANANPHADVAPPSDGEVALRNGQYDLHHQLLI